MRPSHLMLDFLALLSSRGIGQALSILIGLFLVRAISDSLFGAYSLATTTIGLAGVIADFGLDPILTRDSAANPGLLPSAIRARFVFALAVTALVTLAAALTPFFGRADLLLIGGISLVPRGMMRAVAATLVGTGRARNAAWMEGVALFATSILTVILVLVNFLGDGAAAAMWALVLGNAAGLAVAFGDRSFFLFAKAGSSHQPYALLRAAFPFVVMSLAGALFQSLDVYIVKQFYWIPTNPDAVALYAAPFRVLNALLLVPTVWGVVVLPHYKNHDNPSALLRRDLWRAFGAGLALSVGCTLLARPITLLALGPTYTDSAPILAVLCWMTLPVCLSAPYIALLTVTNRQRRIAISVVVAGLLALAANLALASDPARSLMTVAGVKVASMFILLAFYHMAQAGKQAVTP